MVPLKSDRLLKQLACLSRPLLLSEQQAKLVCGISILRVKFEDPPKKFLSFHTIAGFGRGLSGVAQKISQSISVRQRFFVVLQGQDVISARSLDSAEIVPHFRRIR